MEKKPTLNKEFVENFKKAYLTIFYNICQKWIQDEDSCNNYYQTCVRQVEEFEFMKVVFQPGKQDEDDLVPEAHVLILVDKKVPIKKLEKEAMRKVQKEVNEILLTDYYEFRKATNDKWYREVPKSPTAEQVLDIYSPLKEFKKNCWKLSFRINDDMHGPGSRGWVPKRISEFLGEENEEWYKEVVENIKGE